MKLQSIVFVVIINILGTCTTVFTARLKLKIFYTTPSTNQLALQTPIVDDATYTIRDLAADITSYVATNYPDRTIVYMFAFDNQSQGQNVTDLRDPLIQDETLDMQPAFQNFKYINVHLNK